MRPFLALLLALAACAPSPAPEASRAPDPNGLLHAMQACLADPAGADCTAVDRARGFVVIKDDSPEKPEAWLIVPDHEVTGIESPAVFRPPVADFWRYGWEAGARLLPPPARRPRPCDQLEAGRSQDLLHIHISCVLPAVRDALAGAAVGPDWAAAPFFRFGKDVYNVAQGRDARAEPLPAARRAAGRPPPTWAGSRSPSIGSADGGFFLVTHSDPSPASSPKPRRSSTSAAAKAAAALAATLKQAATSG